MTPTPEIMSAWSDWFVSMADKIVGKGRPCGAGRKITKTGTEDLPLDRGALTGYLIIEAENIDEAEKIA